MTTLLVGALRAVSVRLVIPWTGAWIADVDFDLEAARVVPTGRVALKIGETGILAGAIDERASGRFGEKARARVVGGAGGWDKTVAARHFHNDAGVLSSAVFAATAAEVGETVTEATPSRLGVDFVRTAGPASRVLAGRDWYVDVSGVTVVGPRPTFAASSNVEVLSWDPNTQRAEIASDDVLRPGTLLVDPRFGSATVRDVEQTFSDAGARATAWCAKETGSRLATALTNLVREASGVIYLKTYRYRVVDEEADGRFTLQAVKRASGIPDAIAIPAWAGMAGLTAKVVPGSEVLVEFIDGDPSQPVVRAFDGTTPLELELDAAKVSVGTGAAPVARATELLAWAANVNAALNALLQPIAPLAPSVASTKLFTD
jgi:hypothetical protein